MMHGTVPPCSNHNWGYFATESYSIPESEKQEDAEMKRVGAEINESLTGLFDTITCSEQVIR
jgi:hypothetical protein